MATRGLKHKKYLYSSLILTGALLIFFTYTNPDNIAVGLLLVPVILIFLILFFFSSFMLGQGRTNDSRKSLIGAFAVSGGLTLIIMLLSVSTLHLYELLLVVLLIGLLIFYLRRSF